MNLLVSNFPQQFVIAAFLHWASDFWKYLNRDILSYFVNSFTVRQMIFFVKFLDFLLYCMGFFQTMHCAIFPHIRMFRTRILCEEGIKESVFWRTGFRFKIFLGKRILRVQLGEDRAWWGIIKFPCTVLKISRKTLHSPSLPRIKTISSPHVRQKNLTLYQWQTCVLFKVKCFIFYSAQKLFVHNINLLPIAVHHMRLCRK